jgi:site-specific recombinase XerD
MPADERRIDDLIAAYVADHRSRNSSPATIAHYQATMADYARFVADTRRSGTLGELTRETLQDFHAWLVATPLRKPWRGSTVRAARSIQGQLKDIRAILAWAVEHEYLDKAPRVALPKVPHRLFPIFTDAELVTLFSCPHLTARGSQGVRNRAILATLLDSGIRLAELVGMKPADLMLDDGLIKIVSGKGDRSRIVPVSSSVVAYLQEWLAVRGEDDGTLFWLTRDGVKMLLRRIRAETGLLLHSHKLRHTAATKLVRSGIDLHTVRRILGHQQLSTVEVYLSLSNDDIKAKHNAASPFESIWAQMPVDAPKHPKRRRLTLDDVA